MPEPVSNSYQLAQELRDACNGHPDAKIPWPHRLLHRAADAVERIADLERFAARVNEIRNSIIGRQRVNWSMHIYPLVKALKEIGIDGDGYEIAREKAKQENEILHAELAAAQTTLTLTNEHNDQLFKANAQLKLELAAAQETISRKDEALRDLLVAGKSEDCDKADECFDNDRAGFLAHDDPESSAAGGCWFSHCWCATDEQKKAREALALPADRSCLDAMLAEAEKRGMLKAARRCWNHWPQWRRGSNE